MLELEQCQAAAETACPKCMQAAPKTLTEIIAVVLSTHLLK